MYQEIKSVLFHKANINKHSFFIHVSGEFVKCHAFIFLVNFFCFEITEFQMQLNFDEINDADFDSLHFRNGNSLESLQSMIAVKYSFFPSFTFLHFNIRIKNAISQYIIFVSIKNAGIIQRMDSI